MGQMKNFMWTLLVLIWELVQYHGCWWPGSLCCQAISSHGIDCAGLANPCFQQVMISMTSCISVLRNNRKCKYIFVLHKINSGWQGSVSFLSITETCMCCWKVQGLKGAFMIMLCLPYGLFTLLCQSHIFGVFSQRYISYTFLWKYALTIYWLHHVSHFINFYTFVVIPVEM